MFFRRNDPDNGANLESGANRGNGSSRHMGATGEESKPVIDLGRYLRLLPPIRAMEGVRKIKDWEIILRAEGRVRYLRVSARHQKIAASLLGGVALWLVAANGAAYWQSAVIENKNAEIREAKVAYEQVRSDLGVYRERLGALAENMARAAKVAGEPGAMPDLDLPDARIAGLSTEFEELAAISSRIEGAFDRIAEDLDVTEAERRRIIQSRDHLHDRIASLEEQLARSRRIAASLRTDLGETHDTLDGVRAETRQLQSERKALRDRIAVLETDLKGGNHRIAELRTELDEATAALGEARSRGAGLNRRRAELEEQVAQLTSGLEVSRAEVGRLDGELAQVSENLEAVEAERAEIDENRARLTSRITALERTLAVQRRATEDNRERVKSVVAKLVAVTDGSIRPDDRATTLQTLENQIGDLVSELNQARTRAEGMETTLGEVVVGLAKVAGNVPTLDVASGGEPEGRARDLLNRIQGAQDSQREMIERLSEQTRESIRRSEEILKMTGLDVSAFLRAAGLESGLGGPVQVASLGELSGTHALEAEISTLESRINRLRDLQQALKCMPLAVPTDAYQVTSRFGNRRDPITNKMAEHKGLDLGGWTGLRIHAAGPGRVTFAGRKGGYGRLVEIDHGCGVVSRYAHMRKITVKKGEEVSLRDVVGRMGSSGRSTGTHLHYEILVNGVEMDPEKFIEAGRHVFKI